MTLPTSFFTLLCWRDLWTFLGSQEKLSFLCLVTLRHNAREVALLACAAPTPKYFLFVLLHLQRKELAQPALPLPPQHGWYAARHADGREHLQAVLIAPAILQMRETEAQGC